MSVAKFSCLVGSVIALGASSQMALAVSLPVGTTISISGTTLALRPELASVDVINKTIPFSFLNTSTGGQISGSLFDDVTRETGTGTLDFLYQVTLNAGSSSAGAITTNGFTGFSSDVGFRTDGTGTIDPNQAERFSGASAGMIDFIFGTTPMTAGHVTQFEFIKTTATAYNTTGISTITADTGAGTLGSSAALSTYAPAVPEPSMLLVPVAALGLASLRRRKSMHRLNNGLT